MCFKSSFTTPAVAALCFCFIGGTVPAPAYADQGDQLFKLLADDGAANDLFGASVAISGTTAVVGAIEDDDNGYNSGSVYVFDTTSGQQVLKLLANDGSNGDELGNPVAISGSTVIVAARGDDGHGIFSGSAYLFDTATGQQLFKLLSNDGHAFDRFGNAVAISGNIAIIGAPGWGDLHMGAAYLFDTTTGQQLFRLMAEDQGGAEDDNFGNSVAISGTTAIIGSYWDNDNGIDSGSAYLFDISDPSNPVQIAKLLPEDGAADDWFGTSVAISGTTAIIGASRDDDNGDYSGSAYLFDTTTGQQIAKLLPDDGSEFDWFGSTIALSGTVAIVGAQSDVWMSDTSAAYLFDTITGQQLAKLLTSDGPPEGQGEFGNSVAIFGTTAIVGAKFDDDNEPASGSAYLFDAGICSSANPEAVFVFDSKLPYFSEADSPFDTDSARYTLENFEDGLFDIPGVSVSGGEVRFPSTHTDSVDMDDGVLDGFGTDGHSFLQSNGQNGITFTFDSKILNGLPSKVGLVWTDGNAQAVVSFTATDAKGECLGFFQLVLGDDVNNGTTGEDRFLGLEFAGGISSVSISTSLGGIEVDHLQFVLPCSWDLDDSGSVGASDLLALLAGWGPCKGCPADFDGNGNVGASDLLVLLANWGPCP